MSYSQHFLNQKEVEKAREKFSWLVQVSGLGLSILFPNRHENTRRKVFEMHVAFAFELYKFQIQLSLEDENQFLNGAIYQDFNTLCTQFLCGVSKEKMLPSLHFLAMDIRIKHINYMCALVISAQTAQNRKISNNNNDEPINEMDQLKTLSDKFYGSKLKEELDFNLYFTEKMYDSMFMFTQCDIKGKFTQLFLSLKPFDYFVTQIQEKNVTGESLTVLGDIVYKIYTDNTLDARSKVLAQQISQHCILGAIKILEEIAQEKRTDLQNNKLERAKAYRFGCSLAVPADFDLLCTLNEFKSCLESKFQDLQGNKQNHFNCSFRNPFLE